MLGFFRDKITILEKEDGEAGAFGSSTTWKENGDIWGAVTSISTEGQAKYQQLGHSEVSYIFKFPQKLDLSISDNRFEWDGKTFTLVEPPKHLGNQGARYLTSVAVKEVVNDG